jgi:uncharacterized protein YecT (DUF1311 family)
MFKTRAVTFGLILVASLAAGWPASLGQHMNAPNGPCKNAGSSTAEQSQCFSAAYREADKKLNDVYAQVLKTLAPEAQQSLQAAERLWIQFRDANCEVEHGLYKGGSAAPMVLTACLEALTRQRADDLMTMLGYRVQR